MEKSQRFKIGGLPDGRAAGGASAGIEVELLRRRFEKFRRDHLRRTRIPDVLRAAALAAVDRGAPDLDVRRACKATSVQLTQWRKELRPSTQASVSAEHTARVFQVVEEAPEIDAVPGPEPSAQELELRLGGWTIRIHKLGA
jgi:transposase-like protein